ncbi:hypothetical protein OIU76_012125 [Salix suchowensis]|nr:hypothetical protein OIU76_012125 [Salix suchowensis]
MHSANHWGGSFEIYNGAESTTDDEKSRNMEWDKAALQPQRHHLDETQQSWLLYRQEKKKKKFVDLGCVACSHRALKWTLYASVFVVLVIALPTVLAKALPRHEPRPSPPDNYTLALHKALLFFNAQKYLTQKYEAIGEYKHTRDLIKWGTDYLLLTFNSSASKIDKIYCQVGGSHQNGPRHPDDRYCWQRPEDMDYPRPSRVVNAGSDLAGEMAAALAAASIVFRDNEVYSRKLVKGAETVYAFARDLGKRKPYSRGKPFVEPFYNSSGYYDEYIWGATWLYYATGNINYMRWATEPGFSKHSKALYRISDLSVLSWDNKLPAAMLLLTRYRIFLNPGYPYEEMLHMYHNKTELNMCSYLRQFNVFNWTKGGLIRLNSGRPRPLQYVANTAFLASLFVDYLNATRVPGFQCGSKFISLDVLRSFATSQVPFFKIEYSCTGGWKWRDSPRPNPNNITGAMVGGPDRFDRFRDVRTNGNFTEPTLAGNAGLVAALSSLTSSGGIGIDKNTMFSAVPPLYPPTPPPPPAWKP